jgi:hypothetical protein
MYGEYVTADFRCLALRRTGSEGIDVCECWIGDLSRS